MMSNFKEVAVPSMTSITSTHKCSVIAFSCLHTSSSLPFMDLNAIRYVFEEMFFFSFD